MRVQVLSEYAPNAANNTSTRKSTTSQNDIFSDECQGQRHYFSIPVEFLLPPANRRASAQKKSSNSSGGSIRLLSNPGFPASPFQVHIGSKHGERVRLPERTSLPARKARLALLASFSQFAGFLVSLSCQHIIDCVRHVVICRVGAIQSG